MKSAPVVIALAGVALLAAYAAVPRSKAADGKEVFLTYKCNSCHSIKSQSIAKKADPAEEEEKSESDRKPPDLSSVGKKHNADWITKFMLKQIDNDGEKHRKRFKGTEAELKLLAGWLETLKAEKTDKKAK